MKKNWLIVLIAVTFGLLMLTACMKTPVDTEKAKKEAVENFENGNFSEAEESLKTVLKHSADDPEANAAMAFIKFYYGIKNSGNVIGDFIRLYYEVKNLGDVIGEASSIAGESEPTIREVLTEVKTLQDTLDEEAIPYFEEALKYAETALEGKEIDLKLYPNKIDWDEDEVNEPEEPLKFRIIDPQTHETLAEVSMRDFYSCDEKAEYLEDAINGEVIAEIDQSGGDAVFNYETFEEAALGEDPCEAAIEFGENDYFTIDKGEVYAIKVLTEYILAYLYPTTIYSFELPDEVVSALQDSINFGNPAPIIDCLDKNDDTYIDNSEWKEQLNNFLTFRDYGSNHLKNELVVIGNAAKDYLSLLDEIAVDDQGFETHNLTSSDFISEDVYTVSDSERESINELVSYTLENNPIIIKDEYEETVVATVNLYLLRTNPENFSDLKDFLPKVQYSPETYEITIIEFPDETFGGLLELAQPINLTSSINLGTVRDSTYILKNIAGKYVMKHLRLKMENFMDVFKRF